VTEPTPRTFSKPLLEVLLCPVGQFYGGQRFAALAGVRQHGYRPDRAGRRIEAQDAGFFDFGAQQGFDGGHFFAHIVRRFAAVDVQAELNHHHALAFVIARGQGVDTGDRVDAFFHLFGDFALHNFGEAPG